MEWSYIHILRTAAEMRTQIQVAQTHQIVFHFSPTIAEKSTNNFQSQNNQAFKDRKTCLDSTHRRHVHIHKKTLSDRFNRIAPGWNKQPHHTNTTTSLCHWETRHWVRVQHKTCVRFKFRRTGAGKSCGKYVTS